MYILHIETSTKICSVALSQDGSLLSFVDEMDGSNHTSLLAPMIRDLLKSASITIKDLGAISVCSGPGSYTGLRVGGSTAKAMAYSLNIPLLSIPTLAALAWAGFKEHPEADYVLPMLDARRNEVYLNLYDRDMQELFPTSSVILDKGALSFIPEYKKSDEENTPKRISTKSFSLTICCGDGAFKLNTLHLTRPGIIVDDQILSVAQHQVSLAFRLLSARNFSDPMHFVPSYLKPPNITQPKNVL